MNTEGEITFLGARPRKVVPSIYQHYKGNYYLVTGITTESGTEDLEGGPALWVEYRLLYDDFSKRVRRLSEYCEMVKRTGYVESSRFKRVCPMYEPIPRDIEYGLKNWQPLREYFEKAQEAFRDVHNFPSENVDSIGWKFPILPMDVRRILQTADDFWELSRYPK
ncbi:MAG: DUF1653 domain-containing protein [bacterium]|nr:DUF1653 domain-containing protein [bacterium]